MTHIFCTECIKEIAKGLDGDAYRVLAELSAERLGQGELMDKTDLSIYRLRAALNCLRGARLITLDIDKLYILSDNGERMQELAEQGAIL